MKLIVGLGNPGQEYEITRHNTGRIVLFSLLNKEFYFDKKVNALCAEMKIGKNNVKLVAPETFMNNSGKTMAHLVKAKKDLKDLVVIYDDIDLPLGKIKISFNRSAGGHNGLGSVIKALKSEEFLRIRVGISPATPKGVVKKPKGEKAVLNFLLGEFKKQELEIIKKLSKTIAKAVETIFTEGKDKAMSLYNK